MQGSLHGPHGGHIPNPTSPFKLEYPGYPMGLVLGNTYTENKLLKHLAGKK